MSRPDDDIALLLVDGDNLLHRLRGGRDVGGLAWLIPRLRACLPPSARAVVVLDGAPDPGQPMHHRAAPSVELRHSGRVDGDTAILEILAQRPFSERGRTVVVTDDRALSDRARRAGGLTRRLDWLNERLERPGPSRSAGSISAGRPPAGSAERPDEQREPWRPGRGATRKRGNPRRGSARLR